MEIIRWLALVILIAFSGYTIYAIRKENFWKSLRTVLALKWGRQVTIDLYLGLLLFSFFVYLNEGSVLMSLLWLVPTMILGNLIPLLYFVIHFHSLTAHFM